MSRYVPFSTCSGLMPTFWYASVYLCVCVAGGWGGVGEGGRVCQGPLQCCGLPVILPLLKADWVQTPALEILKCAPQPNFCRALLLARRGHVVRGGG